MRCGTWKCCTSDSVLSPFSAVYRSRNAMMNYRHPTQLQAAILDWAGTVVDFGSFAPTQIFVEAFAEFDVQVSIEEARGPMGMGKWDHIRTLCDQPQIAERYRAVFGRVPSDDD